MDELLRKIRSREAKIAVIGLGYVGLPLAVEKAKAGFQVVGIERTPERVKLEEGAQSNAYLVMGGIRAAVPERRARDPSSRRVQARSVAVLLVGLLIGAGGWMALQAPGGQSRIRALVYNDVVRFSIQNEKVALLRAEVFDLAGKRLFDSQPLERASMIKLCKLQIQTGDGEGHDC